MVNVRAISSQLAARFDAGDLEPRLGGAGDRFLRLHAFEFLIFAVLFVLLALALASAPLLGPGPGPALPPRAGGG
jgi:hypothetical protein